MPPSLRRVLQSSQGAEYPGMPPPAPASPRVLTSMKEIREEIIVPLMEQHPYLDGWHRVYVVEQAEHEIPLGRVTPTDQLSDALRE